MMAILLSLLCAVSGALSATLITLPDIKVGDSVTLPCKLHEDSAVEKLEVRWLLGEHLIITLTQDHIIYSIIYRNRAELPAGGADHGDFSLIITHTQHGDSGVYRCVIFREKQEELTLSELQLTVKVPLSPSAVFARVGDDVVVPCFGRVDWLGSEAKMVQWKRNWKVLELVKGSLYVDPQFEGRVSLSKERILQDNISLELKSTHHEDQGLYECSFVKDQAIRLTAQISLTVTDHMTWLKVGLGSSVHLPLHSVSPVIVRFLPDGVNHPVQVCEVEKGQVKCGAAYSHRTGLYNQSLELKNLCMEDSGTFSVMERETQHTVSVIFINVLPPGDTVVQADSITVWIILISTVLFVLISIFTIKIYLKWRRGRQRPEVHPPNHTDATRSKSSTNNVQPTNSII